MAVITISRQLGSAGTEVAHKVAQGLGYRAVWRELINEAARRAGEPEVALATIDELGLLGLRPSAEACEAYRNSVRQVMEELAAEGDTVIVGRAGQVILRNRPGVLHVRIVAPLGLRCQRIAFAQNIRIEAARAQVEASDRSRRDYLRQCYHVNWDDPELYDLVINTERLTAEATADLVCEASRLGPRAAASNAGREREGRLE